VGEDGALPSNSEVEARWWNTSGLFAADSHGRPMARATGARRCGAMRTVAAFSPRLVGPVLNAPADGAHRRAKLHLFTDVPNPSHST